LGAFGGEVAATAKDVCTGIVKTNSDKGVFPLKIREPMILEANNFLRKKGLFPEDDDSEDEMVFGDDDFPSADAAPEQTTPCPTEEPAPAAEVSTPEKESAPKKDSKKKEEGGKKDKKQEVEKELTPEELEKARKDKLKKVIKEGGKRGVEIEGAADMGGLQFFCTAMDLPDGDLDLLAESMKAMNAKSDPAEEERKGGSGHIGKMIFSAGVEQLAVVAYVPEDKQEQLSCEEWLKTVLGAFGGEVAATAKDVCTGVVKADSDKGVFPLKIREPMILEANNFLRKKGLFPEDDSDDDEMVFGDDDFPSM